MRGAARSANANLIFVRPPIAYAVHASSIFFLPPAVRAAHWRRMTPCSALTMAAEHTQSIFLFAKRARCCARCECKRGIRSSAKRSRYTRKFHFLSSANRSRRRTSLTHPNPSAVSHPVVLAPRRAAYTSRHHRHLLCVASWAARWRALSA